MYVRARLLLLPIDAIRTELAQTHGTVLSLGCGYGLTEIALALCRPDLTIIGSDVDAGRVAVAQRVGAGIANVRFRVEDATQVRPAEPYNAILLVDLLHHLPRHTQEPMLQALIASLSDHGSLIVKEMGKYPRWKYLWNMFHDITMTHGGPLAYRSLEGWETLLTRLGLRVATHALATSQPYPHVMLHGIKGTR